MRRRSRCLLPGIAFLVACAHSPQTSGNITAPVADQSGSVSALVDQQRFDVKLSRGVYYRNNLLGIQAIDFGSPMRQLGLSIYDAVGPGTYGLCPHNGRYAGFGVTDAGGSMRWTSPGDRCMGTITISFLSRDRAIGSFDFQMVPDETSGAMGDLIVSRGLFDVTIAY